MVQLRRLDPLANSGPYQRLLKSPVKSLTLSEAQYDRVKAEHPDLIAAEGEAAVIGLPYRDRLEIHYGFPEVEAFRDRFTNLFNQVMAATSRELAPRGVLLSFRDRPNRATADTLFWLLTLQEGEQWVEMNLFAVPEQEAPAESGEGFSLRDVAAAGPDAVAVIEAQVSGLPQLRPAAVAGMVANAKLFRLVFDNGTPVGYLSLCTEPGGWGVIEEIALLPAAEGLRKPLTEWSIAWLRNNGGRRVRQQAGIDDSATLALLRDLGFTPGETGLNYHRSSDANEVSSTVEGRKGTGTVIKMGDWR
jgi:hypothetical protein